MVFLITFVQLFLFLFNLSYLYSINLSDRKFQSEETASEWCLGQLKRKIIAWPSSPCVKQHLLISFQCCSQLVKGGGKFGQQGVLFDSIPHYAHLDAHS